MICLSSSEAMQWFVFSFWIREKDNCTICHCCLATGKYRVAYNTCITKNAKKQICKEELNDDRYEKGEKNQGRTLIKVPILTVFWTFVTILIAAYNVMELGFNQKVIDTIGNLG